MGNKSRLAVALFATGVVAGGAQANTLSIYGWDKDGSNPFFFEVTANASSGALASTVIQGFNYSGTIPPANCGTADNCSPVGASPNSLSAQYGIAFDVLCNTSACLAAGSVVQEQGEVNTINYLAGTSFSSVTHLTTGIVGSGPNEGDASFTVSGLYFLLKMGPTWGFFKNVSGGAITLAYDALPGEGAGLSHWAQWGEACDGGAGGCAPPPPGVPGPVVGAGLPGLLAACAGLLALARRRRQRSA